MSDLEKIEELENQIKQLEKDKVKELKQWKNITTNKETYEALGFGPAEEDGVFDQWPIVRDARSKKFDMRIREIQKEIKQLEEAGGSSIVEHRSTKRRRMKENLKVDQDHELESSESEFEPGGRGDTPSMVNQDRNRFDDGGSSETNGNIDHIPSKGGSSVIELLDSDSDGIEEESGHKEPIVHDANNEFEFSEDEEKIGEPNKTTTENDDNESFIRRGLDSEDEFDSDDDEDDISGEIRNEQIHHIEVSRLSMAIQGFRQKAIGVSDKNRLATPCIQEQVNRSESEPFDPQEVAYQNHIFQKDRCYCLKTGSQDDSIVGINCFISKDIARCVLIVKFEETFIGIDQVIESEDLQMLLNNGKYVQVHKEESDIQLSKLGNEVSDINEIVETKDVGKVGRDTSKGSDKNNPQEGLTYSEVAQRAVDGKYPKLATSAFKQRRSVEPRSRINFMRRCIV